MDNLALLFKQFEVGADVAELFYSGVPIEQQDIITDVGEWPNEQ